MIHTLPPIVHEPTLWVHANSPSSPTGLPGFEGYTWQQLFLEAANAWMPYSKRMILGCRDTQAEKFFNWFLPRAPSGIHVTGAIQAPMALHGWGFFPTLNSGGVYDLYDARKWRLVASHVLAIAAWTGTNEVVIDMEGPFGPFHRGDVGLIPPRLREAIKPLADIDVDILWYFPDILEDTANFPTRRECTIKLVELFAEVPNFRFMCTRLARPQNWERPERIRCAHELLSMVGWDRVHFRTICTKSGVNGNKPCYTPETVQKVLEAMPYGPVSIYPGGAALLETAGAFGDMAAL